MASMLALVQPIRPPALPLDEQKNSPQELVDCSTVDLQSYLTQVDRTAMPGQQLVGWGSEGFVWPVGPNLVVKVFESKPILRIDIALRTDARARDTLQQLENTYRATIGYEELFAFLVGQVGFGPVIRCLAYSNKGHKCAMLMDRWQYTLFDFMNGRGAAAQTVRDRGTVIEHAAKAIEVVVNINAVLGVQHYDLRSTNVMFTRSIKDGSLVAGLIDFERASFMQVDERTKPINVNRIDTFVADELMHSFHFARPVGQPHASDYRHLVGELLWALTKRPWTSSPAVLPSRSNVEDIVNIVGSLLAATASAT